MTRSIFLSLFALLGACADPAPSAAAASSASAPTASASAPAVSSASAPAAAVRMVDVATLKADLDRGAVPLLIDVRTPEEFAAGHVSGAKNVPLSEVEGRTSELGSPATDVYVICQSGGRSAQASATLVGKGFHPVDVAGGTGAWVSAGYPVVR